MYNSRPRDYRGGFAVPENYSGNAFVDGEKNERDEEISGAEDIMSDKKEELESACVSDGVSERAERSTVSRGASRFGLNVGRLFRGGIGFEELLIIALILLMAQGDNNDDVIVLLALLLFIS